ncbi:LysR family transcriptional regulator [Novosphingobium sediminicola]|uniref:DNA-binding transcriptional LysR family regulator n=2 Tax=Novosphingobium TaxID=165696 RepID=A0A7W6CLI8_9SPHN|nr:LysR family transcriptional regulator [Novosphingobium sediminicola]MBB3957675.1 DNA-binding transcriptional LysR family regulator [Novosphingobium sediminicola]
MRPNQLSDIQYDALELFERVARSGSIAAAARGLGISASTATRKLLTLEKALNARLFKRTTRSLSLTEAGALALDWAQTSLIALEETADDLAAITGAPSGRIRLAAPHFGMNTYLPPVLSSFSRAYPRINLEIVTTDDLVNPATDGFDIVIRYGTLPDSRNVAVRLTEFDRIVCASPEYLAEYGMPNRLEDLAVHQCIVHQGHDETRWSFEREGQLLHQPILARIRTDNAFSIEMFAVEGAGIARLPTITVRRNLACGRLVRLLADYQCVEPSGDKSSIWVLHSGQDMPYRVRIFMDHLKAQIPAARQAIYNS